MANQRRATPMTAESAWQKRLSLLTSRLMAQKARPSRTEENYANSRQLRQTRLHTSFALAVWSDISLPCASEEYRGRRFSGAPPGSWSSPGLRLLSLFKSLETPMQAGSEKPFAPACPAAIQSWLGGLVKCGLTKGYLLDTISC